MVGTSLTVPSHLGAAKADGSVLLVRPESISVKAARKASGPGIGVVKNAVFYGNHVEYEFETPDGLIGAVVSDPIYSEIVQVGESAQYDFESNRSWLLPA